MIQPTPTQRSSAACAWSDCGRPGGVEAILLTTGQPSRTVHQIGRYCRGHSVIAGIDAHAHYGGQLWCRPATPAGCGPAARRRWQG
jgi:hypothetical protein